MDPKELLQSKRVLQIFISKVHAIRVCCILLVIITAVDYFDKVFFFLNCKLDIGKPVSFKNFTTVNFERRVNFPVMNSKIWKRYYVLQA